MSTWKYKAYRSIWSALDLLFPPQCGGCGKQGVRWCDDCRRNVQVLDGIVCDICGLPQDKPGVCGVCLANRPHFRSLRAWAVFEEPVQSALIAVSPASGASHWQPAAGSSSHTDTSPHFQLIRDINLYPKFAPPCDLPLRANRHFLQPHFPNKRLHLQHAQEARQLSSIPGLPDQLHS